MRPQAPGTPTPQEWLDQLNAWSRHNIAFAVHPGALWIGTPDGELIELGFLAERMTVHSALPGASITALCATPSGDLLAATSDGHLTAISVTTSSETAGAPEGRTPQELVTAFLEGTSDAPPDGRLEDLLVVTYGERTWDHDDLETVTSTTSADPSWLQIQAAMNTYKQETKGN